jgi:hypothetical protein
MKRLDAEGAFLRGLRDYWASLVHWVGDDSEFMEQSCSPQHVAEYVRDYAMTVMDSWIVELTEQDPDLEQVLAAVPGIEEHVLSCILPPASDGEPQDTCLMDMEEAYRVFFDPARVADASKYSIPGAPDRSEGCWERLFEKFFEERLGVSLEHKEWFSLEAQLRFSLRSPRNRAFFVQFLKSAFAERRSEYRLQCEKASLGRRLRAAKTDNTDGENKSAPVRSKYYSRLEKGERLRSVFGRYKRETPGAKTKVVASNFELSPSTVEHFITDFDRGKWTDGAGAHALERVLKLESGDLARLFRIRAERTVSGKRRP